MTILRMEPYEAPRQTTSRMAEGLCLLATPVFVLMALLTAAGGDMLCTMSGMSALGGMSAMYLLMGLFHLTPWLKRIAQSRNHANKE